MISSKNLLNFDFLCPHSSVWIEQCLAEAEIRGSNPRGGVKP